MKKNKKQAGEDKSPIVPQKHKIKNEIEIYQRELTTKQKQFLDIALDKNTKLMFVSGPAGTSKTYMATFAMLLQLMQKKLQRQCLSY